MCAFCTRLYTYNKCVVINREFFFSPYEWPFMDCSVERMRILRYDAITLTGYYLTYFYSYLYRKICCIAAAHRHIAIPTKLVRIALTFTRERKRKFRRQHNMLQIGIRIDLLSLPTIHICDGWLVHWYIVTRKPTDCKASSVS